MNIAILGAGAMGSLFGGLLAESGQAVTLLDINDAHIQAIREHGLRLGTDAGDRQVRTLTACHPEQATAPPDLLIVFTKSLHTASALEGIARLIGPQTLVLTLQNGLGNVESVSKFAPLDRILVGMTTWPADVAGQGHVRSHGQGIVRIMAADRLGHSAKVATAFSDAGLRCTEDHAVWKAIWEKVAFNAALNSICAVTGCTVDQLGAAPEGMALASAVIDEVVAVARAEGVPADADPLPRVRFTRHRTSRGPQAIDAAGHSGRQAHRSRRHQRGGGGERPAQWHRRPPHEDLARSRAFDGDPQDGLRLSKQQPLARGTRAIVGANNVAARNAPEAVHAQLDWRAAQAATAGSQSCSSRDATSSGWSRAVTPSGVNSLRKETTFESSSALSAPSELPSIARKAQR